MDGRTYSYLELAALPAVGSLLLDGRPAFVFASDGQHVRFANAAGMTFLGATRMGEALARQVPAGSALAKQLARLGKLLPADTSRLEMLRFHTGAAPAMLAAACRRLNLPDGSRALLVVGAGDPPRESVVARAEKLADAIASRDCLAAVIGREGRVLAASGGFDELTPASATVDALIEEFAGSDRRLLKRALSMDGATRPAGIVRFDSGPQELSLLVVGPEEARAMPEAELPPAEPARTMIAPEAEAASAPLAGPLEDAEAAPELEGRAAPEMPLAAEDPVAPTPVTRFLWQTDREHRFGFVSPELADVVGPINAGIVGRRWADIAEALALDPEDRVAKALAGEANWSAIEVGWPVDGRPERSAIDLTGFATHGRSGFEGYRGMGTIRQDAHAAMLAPLSLGPLPPDMRQPEPVATGPAAASVNDGTPTIEQAVEGAPAEVPASPADGSADETVTELPAASTEEISRAIEGAPDDLPALTLPAEPTSVPEMGDTPRPEAPAIERAVEGAPDETPAPAEPPPPAVPSAAPAPSETEIEQAVEGAPDVAAPAPRSTISQPPLVLSDEDIDAAARRSIEEGRMPRPTAARPVEVVETPGLGDEDEPPEPAEPQRVESAPVSNVVRLPAQPTRILPERLSGSEQDAFRRIAEALGARMNREPEAGDEAPSEPVVAVPTPAMTGGEVDARILDKVPAGLVIYRDRRTLFVNRALLDMLGYASAEAFIEAGGAEAVFPDPNDGGPRPALSEGGGTLSALRADGGTVPVDARLHAVPFEGSTALMLSLSRRPEPRQEPVSDQALLDHLIAAERRIDELQAILDTATDGIVVIDEDGRIDNINRSAEALFGIEATEVLRRPFTELLAEESRKAALDYLDGLAENGVASVLNDGREVIGKVPKGGLIPMFMTMGRLGDGPKFCAVLRDITHWKNVEEELVAAKRAAETANSQKSEFLARISHEIRTPLNAIIGFSEVMMEERFGPVGNERYRDYLRDIHVSGTHMLSLINDLLDLSKIEAGKMELAFESVAVNEIIQECVALMQPQANRERIIIRTSLSAGVPNVVADERSLRQILLNLLSNAVKFTGAGGQVIVATALEDNGEVTLRIRDTGVGMSDKDIETAMKPFRQVGSRGRGRGEGTGLGLPLTKALVEANRATFAIDSAPNQGTLVKITFPTTRVLAG